MLRSCLCDHSNAYILVKETIIVKNKPTQGQPNNAANKKVTFKNLVPFTNFISRINNTQVDDAHYIDVVISMCNLTEYNDNCSKTSGIVWKYYRDGPTLAADAITDFSVANIINESFKVKENITD